MRTRKIARGLAHVQMRAEIDSAAHEKKAMNMKSVKNATGGLVAIFCLLVASRASATEICNGLDFSADTIIVGDLWQNSGGLWSNQGVHCHVNGTNYAKSLTTGEALTVDAKSGNDWIEFVNSVNGNVPLGITFEMRPITSVSPGLMSANGGSGADDIYGSNGADDLQGGSGDDVIYGNGGADVIIGKVHLDCYENFNSFAYDECFGGDGGDQIGCAEHVQGEGGTDTCWEDWAEDPDTCETEAQPSDCR